MSNLKVCRVCLSRDVKMYNMKDFKLRIYYEEIMAQEVKDELPRYFCYVCATMMLKYHKFREQCYIGQKILTELQKKGPITLASISQVKKGKLSTNLMTEMKILQPYIIMHNAIDRFQIKTETDTVVPHDHEKEIETEYDYSTEFKYHTGTTEIDKDILKTERKHPDEHKMSSVFENSDTESENVFDDDKPMLLVVEEKIKNNVKNKKQNAIKKTEVQLKTKCSTVYSKRKTRKPSNTSKSKNRDRRKKEVSRRLPPLDPVHWLQISLNEESALENFKLRAKDSKYLEAVYKCENCYTTFSTPEIMDRHMRLNHCESRGLHECHFCHKRFRLKCLVTEHIIVHYNKFQCLRCDLTFQSERSARNHDVFHSGKMLPCKHCGMEFRHKSSYYSHLRIYHRTEHVCPLCGESFVSNKGLQQHKILRHWNTKTSREEGEDQSTYCERCDIKFETHIAFHEHFQQSVKHARDDDEPDQVGAIDTSAPLKGGSTKTFTRASKSRPTTCPVCAKLFRSYSQFTKHHRREHKGVPLPLQKSYDITQVCEICGVTIKGRTIRYHMNLHTKQKAYSCQTCGAQFLYLTSYTRHQLTHTGEKPHKCPLCEKRFTQKVSMQLHHRTFHLKQPYPKRIRRKENKLVKKKENVTEYSD